MGKAIKGLMGLLLILSIHLCGFSQQSLNDYDKDAISFDITDIRTFDERIVFIYELMNDCRFEVTTEDSDGLFLIHSGEEGGTADLAESFAAFRQQSHEQFYLMDKFEASALAKEYKSKLPDNIVLSLMMDIYVKSRENNLCESAAPFCTDNGMYNFPAGVNAGSGESGPNYDCLGSTPNPAWYYMKIANPGSMTIHMFSTPGQDIDFCCWGPFTNPLEPCPNGLTGSKVVSCSYSPQPTENCIIPSSAQTGEYYILVITNFSNSACNISFSKTSGNGTTDCSIMPPLVDNDGPYCIGDDIHLTSNAQSAANYHWTGPNGFNSNKQNPTIPNANLSHSGTYTCTITIGSQSNNASTEVQVYALPSADFTATSVCQGNSTQFTNNSTTNPDGQNMTYEWDFGDGQSSSQRNPTHQYAAAGTYPVTLTASCGNGACTNTKTRNVEVYTMPVANAGMDQTIDYESTAQLQGSGGFGNFDYHWEPADKVLNPNAAQTQTVSLTDPITFTLTVTNPLGDCISTDEVNILVNGPALAATVSATPISICLGSSTQLQATAVGGTGNYTYSWTPTDGIGNPSSPNPVAYPTETTTYTCIVNDGQTTQSLSTTVTVYYPEEEEETQYICPGESYNFYGTDYADEGDYEYLTTTAQGCEKTITLHLRHHPTYDNAHTTTEYICGGTSYLFHGQSYNNSGLYSKTLQTIHGCDSVVWLNLTVYPINDTIFLDPEICVNQTYNFHGTEYDQDGTVVCFDTIDEHGCPLVERLELHVGEYQTPPIDEQNICYGHDESPSFYWDKTQQTYTEDTYDEIILPDPNGDCDFRYRLNLKFHQEYYDEDEVTSCDEYYWPVTGETFTATNHHIERHFDHYVGQNFICDSTFILDLTINQSNESTLVVEDECDEYTWNFGWDSESYTYTESGSYTKTIPTAQGCDSIVTLQLELDYTPDFPLLEGKSWVVGGSEFQYSIEKYWVSTDPRATHTTSWHFSNPNFNQWQIVPFGVNQDSCLLYIFTFELDSIELCATTQGSCGEFTHSRWIHCGYHGVEETRPEVNVEVFPNPNDGYMTIAFENMNGEITVQVLDLTGMTVDRFSVTADAERTAYRYNASHLPPGAYFICITNHEGTMTKKVILTK